jgi:hypothetical protein
LGRLSLKELYRAELKREVRYIYKRSHNNLAVATMYSGALDKAQRRARRGGWSRV